MDISGHSCCGLAGEKQEAKKQRSKEARIQGLLVMMSIRLRRDADHEGNQRS